MKIDRDMDKLLGGPFYSGTSVTLITLNFVQNELTRIIWKSIHDSNVGKGLTLYQISESVDNFLM